ncbi:light-harvesting lhii, alpha subunit b / histone protein [hydrocarbon metagenome]|uniref:Light-harvesting lhii, alpha subunit b / histone protein n=1 Tax=hydrocarbon metagenome TaxID=938273 RepID=A0A0W8FM00_9ZZZZ
MKKIFIFAVFLMVMFASMAVQAEVNEDTFTVTPFAGGYVFEGNELQRSSYTVGLRAGYNITENIGVEGYFHYIPTEMRDASRHVPDDPWQNVYGYGIEGLYHFSPENKFVPFIAAGIGFVRYGYPEPYRSTKFAVEYGGGLKYFLPYNWANFFFSETIALRADVRHVIPFNDRYNNVLGTFGIEFSFGAQTKEKTKYKSQEPTSQGEPVAPQAEAAVPAAAVPVEEAAPQAEAPAPVEEVAPAVEAPAPVEEVAPKAEVPVPVAEVAVAAPVVASLATDDVKEVVAKWLNSWRSGDMETYQSCYASDFKAKGMDLDGWIKYKKNVRKRSKDITIDIDKLKISVKDDSAMATFNQSYSSSILKDKGKKTLELKKINNQWKIYREVMWS